MGKKGVSRPPTARPSQRGKTNSAAFGAVPLRAVLAVALAAVVVALYRSRTPPPTPASVAGFADKVADALNSSASVAAARRDQQRVDFWRERLGASRGPYVPPAGCKDLYPRECAAYAQNNECVKNPGWMIVHCAVTCRSCDIRRPEVRCDRRFLNVSDVPAYSPGKMDSVFEELTTSAAFADYRPTVHLRDPWVVTLDSFLTDAEVDGLLNANGLSFVRSTDTGAYDAATGANKKIVSQHRTSSNAWCVGECERAPATRSIHRKIAEVVDIQPDHWENLQVLHYEPGQYYKAHHDYIERDGATPAGPRVLTFFLYLSDVDEGGETCFGKLADADGNSPLCIKPKRGRALIWPSVLSDSLLKQDPRTMHQAQPVTKGVKYAANAWVHLYNFAVPNLWGCTGIFDTLDESNVDDRDQGS